MPTHPDTRLHIPDPCHEDWDAMTPASRGRHCASCDKTVVDVTRMAPPVAVRYLEQVRTALPSGAHVCVRAHADRAGRLLAPSATRRLLTNGLAAVIAMTIAGCQGEGPKVAQPTAQPQPTSAQAVETTPATAPPGTAGTRELMGDVCVQPEPPNVVKGEVEARPTPQTVVTGLIAVAPEPEPSPIVTAPAPEVQDHAVLMGKPSVQHREAPPQP